MTRKKSKSFFFFGKMGSNLVIYIKFYIKQTFYEEEKRDFLTIMYLPLLMIGPNNGIKIIYYISMV